VLAIVLVPSIVLLGTGVAAAVYLFQTGTTAENFATAALTTTNLGTEYATAVEEERRLSLLKLAGDQQAIVALATQRTQTDGVTASVLGAAQRMSALEPQAMTNSNAADSVRVYTEQPTIRKEVDTGRISLDDAYFYYSQLLAFQVTGFQDFGRNAPSTAVAAEMSTTATMMEIVERMSRGNALAVAAIAAGGLTTKDFPEYAKQIGAYHADLDTVQHELTGAEQAMYNQLTATGAWRQLVGMENAIESRGPRTSAPQGLDGLPLSVATWENDIRQVNGGLLRIWQTQNEHAEQLAAESGHSTAVESVWGGIAVLLVAVAVFLVGLLLANRLVRRMRRLRAETLELAEERLPQLVTRLRDGKQIDIDTDVPPLDHGTDELGQVADAFNKAQHTAVAAAVAEARTRAGVNAVFLNLAHRSQVVVHRQLEVLDKAEYNQEDPEQLDLLFQLDHLATRARRNAENLVILGGEQPRRQWRNPVALSEIVRAAASETEEYARIRIARLPEEFVAGTAVADLIHLLAELLDNATSFSPPDSRVDVSGNQAGRGVIVEITDQGLGVPPDELARINAELRETPDFSAMQLSSDSRLGLFVVGRLAARHGISVRMAESDYCGIRAIVMIPSALVGGDQQSEPTADDAVPAGPRGGAAWWARRAQRAQQHEMPGPVAGPTWPTEEPEEPARVATAARVRSRAPALVTTPSRQRGAVPPPTDGRPELPRRRRQASLAPQLAQQATMTQQVDVSDDEPAFSPDQSRDFMAAIQTATRRARHALDIRQAGNSDTARAE
jgi:signal transduction histidine kinase